MTYRKPSESRRIIDAKQLKLCRNLDLEIDFSGNGVDRGFSETLENFRERS